MPLIYLDFTVWWRETITSIRPCSNTSRAEIGSEHKFVLSEKSAKTIVCIQRKRTASVEAI